MDDVRRRVPHHGLGVVVDIVPNHLGVADPAQNLPWWDVLRRGRESDFADWFDIDWSRDRILLPVLGDEADPADLTVNRRELAYGGTRYPLARGTESRPGDTAADVHDRQFYELVSFRRADAEQSYRRFFTITSLAGVRVEDPAVFDATHAEVSRWALAGEIVGLRIDHPDGLANPEEYVDRLRALAPHAWIVVEKILEPGERLPDWQAEGTTGYDALAEVNQVFISPTGEPAHTTLYRELTGDSLEFADHVEVGKRFVASGVLGAEFNRLAALVPSLPDAAVALQEIAVAFPVYRSYLPTGDAHFREAVAVAGARRPDLAWTFDALVPQLADPTEELCRRFQQTTGAVMAKGVEDTAYYRYSRFAALNEVGGDPAQFGAELGAFHRQQVLRQQLAPGSMTTLSTHDTKRGEDVRARLAVLAETLDLWEPVVRRAMDLAAVPDRALAYLLWQTLAGVGFVDRSRLHAYAEKAMREAALHTTWVDPDADFELTVHAAVDAAYDNAEIRTPFEVLIAQIAPPGRINSLGQKLVQLTMPGVPDVYQGTETWDDSLVDPDNRRPVDFAARRESLDRAGGSVSEPDALKVWVTAQALRLRRDQPQLFSTYQPVLAQGTATEHFLGYDRGGAITVATRLPETLRRSGGWGDTSVTLPGRVHDVLTNRDFTGTLPVAELLAALPVALLVFAA